ncbi:MAG: tetratricopeptide repeat protein [Planctomycetota bacterium]
MHRVLSATLLLGLIAATCPADLLVLNDGRTFTGQVSEDGDQVSIILPYGTLRFQRSEIARIDRKKTPSEQLNSRLAEIRQDNISSLYRTASWARAQGLTDKADEICRQVLKLAPDHARARADLGQLKINDDWQPLSKGLELARSKLAAGKHSQVDANMLADLQAATRCEADELAVGEIKGLVELRSGEFAQARKTFSTIAEDAEGPRAHRLKTIAGILEDNDDGMYVLSKPYPASSSLVSGDDTPHLSAGPASLKLPLTLQAALRDAAKKHIDAGEKQMAEARKAEQTDPETAQGIYKKAVRQFDLADALVPKISRTYRVEIARRRIKSIRNDIDMDAKQFDAMRKKLGTKTLTARQYRTLVLKLVHRLNNVRDGLSDILGIAKPYERDLVLELKWAQADLKKTQLLRKVLMEELKDE